MQKLIERAPPARFVRCLLFALSLTALLPNAASGQIAQTSDSLTRTQMLEDIRLLTRDFERLHAGLYLYQRPQDWALHTQRIEARVPEQASRGEFFLLVNEFIGAVRCGHTRVSMPADSDHLAGRVIPIDTAFVGGRLFIANAMGRPDLRGGEIEAVNDEPTLAVVRRLRAQLPIDGFGEARKNRRLERGFGNYYALFTPGSPGLTRLVVRLGGARQTVVLAGVGAAEFQAWQDALTAERPLYDLRIEGDVAVMRIGGFYNDGATSIDQFIRESFARIRDEGALRLLVDLRDNPGGDDSYGPQLVAHLMPAPFRYYERIEVADGYSEGDGAPTPPRRRERRRLTDHQGTLEQAPAAHAFAGDVVVLVNSRTFSAGSEVAEVLQSSGRALVAGEETNGGHNANSSGIFEEITLPNSGFHVRIPLWFYIMAGATPGYYGRGVVPDYEVSATLEDVLEGRDAVLAAAVGLLAK